MEDIYTGVIIVINPNFWVIFIQVFSPSAANFYSTVLPAYSSQSTLSFIKKCWHFSHGNWNFQTNNPTSLYRRQKSPEDQCGCTSAPDGRNYRHAIIKRALREPRVPYSPPPLPLQWEWHCARRRSVVNIDSPSRESLEKKIAAAVVDAETKKKKRRGGLAKPCERGNPEVRVCL